MIDELKVNLTPDKKEHCLKVTKDLYFVAKQLFEWVQDDSLTVEMSEILPSLIEGHFTDVAKVFGYESLLTKQKVDRHLDIRNANNRIRQLEGFLANSKPIDGLKEQLEMLSRTVRNWWNENGFCYISEFNYTDYGHVKVKFGFMLDSFSVFSETPVTDRKTKTQHVSDLINYGFNIQDIKGDGQLLVDSFENRNLLIQIMRARFPSLKVINFDNHCTHNDDDQFFIRYVNAYIYDLKDLPEIEQGESIETN